MVLDGPQVHRLKEDLPQDLRPHPFQQEERHVALLHRVQEDLPQALQFVPQDLRQHHFQEELQVEELKEPHLEALGVLQNEGQHHHRRHLGGVFQVLHFLEGNPARHLKKLLGVSQDALLDIRACHLV